VRDTRTGDDGEGASGPGFGDQIGAALAAYLITTFILFGGPVQPINLVILHDRLSYLVWIGPLLAAILVGWLAARYIRLNVAAFIVGFLVTLVSLTGIVVDSAKLIETRRLAPDRAESAYFIESLHNSGPSTDAGLDGLWAPKKFQTFLHAAILKDCRAYAWSHRSMGYYELKPDVAQNVLPVDWLQQCPDLRKKQ
jgi:hypothetical protein